MSHPCEKSNNMLFVKLRCVLEWYCAMVRVPGAVFGLVFGIVEDAAAGV